MGDKLAIIGFILMCVGIPRALWVDLSWGFGTQGLLAAVASVGIGFYLLIKNA